MIESWIDLLPRTACVPAETRVHMDSPDATESIAGALIRTASPLVPRRDGIVLLCIGSDRSIGDALGPLVGTQLAGEADGYRVLGTLDHPVHAGNLAETMGWIETNYKAPLVIAVDACLGRLESIGVLTVSGGCLRPGAGVNKSLPAVGDLHLTGVVNVGGFMEYFVLQNTRLSLVMRMARVASRGLGLGLQALVRSRRGTGESDRQRCPS